ncbi:hypothetical protein N8311_01375 [bacterium]|nr:hypothetical protein [bacterium]
MKVYIVDIDGTICTQSISKNGVTDYTLAKPIHERIKQINKLFDDGCEIKYWTARGSLSGINHRELTIKQLKEWGCKYTSLRVGDKPHYDLWIDDKAIWSEEYFRKK